MKQNNNNSQAGIGFPGLLFLVFLVLKLTGVINWSWIWVFAPLWGGFLFIMIALVLIVLFARR